MEWKAGAISWGSSDEYRAVLGDYSQRLLPVVEWQPAAEGNVSVLNDTADPSA